MKLFFILLFLFSLLSSLSSSLSSSNMIINKFNNKKNIKEYLSNYISFLSNQIIQNKGIFIIALSGGSLPEMLEELSNIENDWKNWKIFFIDERCVPLDHIDSNYKSCDQFLLSKVNIPRENIITITSVDDPNEAAKEYEKQFREHVPNGSIDLTLLGVGPDGHTASLFPGHELLSYTGPHVVVPIFDSPKPPSHRITFTLPAINNSTQIMFVATGASKVDTLHQIFTSYQSNQTTNLLPAALIRTSSGSLPIWVVDNDAVPGDYNFDHLVNNNNNNNNNNNAGIENNVDVHDSPNDHNNNSNNNSNRSSSTCQIE